MKFEASILKYMGKFKNGVIVLLLIGFNGKYYESTFFYNKKDILLTIPDEMEKDLGHKIEKDSEYTELLRSILKQIAPYDEVKDIKPIY